MGFLIEPWFALGHWTWGVVSAIGWIIFALTFTRKRHWSWAAHIGFNLWISVRYSFDAEKRDRMKYSRAFRKRVEQNRRARLPRPPGEPPHFPARPQKRKRR